MKDAEEYIFNAKIQPHFEQIKRPTRKILLILTQIEHF